MTHSYIYINGKMQQVSLRSAVIFFNGQTDVRETFTETNSPIKIPEVATWKEKGFMWGEKRGQRHYRAHFFKLHSEDYNV